MKRFVWVILSLVVFSSCTKELSDNFTAYTSPVNDTTWKSPAEARAALTNRLDDLFKVDSYSYSIDINQGGTNGVTGWSVTAPSGFCTDSSSPIYQGTAEMQLVPVKKKGDFIRLWQSTVSRGYVIDAVAAYNLSFTTQSGNALLPVPTAPVHLLVQADAPSQLTKLFYAGQDNMGNFTWTQAGDADGVLKALLPGNGTNISSGYDLILKRWGWLSCGKLVDTSLPTGTITTILPVNYTNMNTVVYAVFKNQLSVVRLNADAFGKVFIANNIPVNADITLISISKRGDDIYIGTSQLTVNKGNNIVKITPQAKTRAQLTSLLDSL